MTGGGGKALAKSAGESAGAGLGEFVGSGIGAAASGVDSAFRESAPQLSAGIDSILDATIGPKAPEVVGASPDVAANTRAGILAALVRWENFAELIVGDTDPNGELVVEGDGDFLIRTARRCEGDGSLAKMIGFHDLCPRLTKASAEAQESKESGLAFFQNPSEATTPVFSVETEEPVTIFNQ